MDENLSRNFDELDNRLRAVETRISWNSPRTVLVSALWLLSMVVVTLAVLYFSRGTRFLNSVAFFDKGGLCYSEIHEFEGDKKGLVIRNHEDERGYFGMVGEAPVLSIRDNKGNYRLSAEFRNDGVPMFALFDRSQKTRVMLNLQPNDTPRLSFFDPNERCRLMLALEENGWPRLSVFDEKKQENWMIRVGDDKTLQFWLREGGQGELRPYGLRQFDDGSLHLRALK